MADELFESGLWLYRAVIRRWIDGDTVAVDIDQGFRDWKHDQHIRIVGIDAPDEQPLKDIATTWAVLTCPPGTRVYIKTFLDRAGEDENSFERWLGHLILPGGGFYADLAVEKKMAVWWDGHGPHPAPAA